MPLLHYSSPSAFWAFVYSSGFPCIRVNPRKILFDPNAVEAWLRQRAVGRHTSKIISIEPQRDVADGHEEGGS